MISINLSKSLFVVVVFVRNKICRKRDLMAMSEESTHRCAQCGRVTTMSCGKCRETYYCSKACQQRHWKENHRATCGDPPGLDQYIKQELTTHNSRAPPVPTRADFFRQSTTTQGILSDEENTTMQKFLAESPAVQNIILESAAENAARLSTVLFDPDKAKGTLTWSKGSRDTPS